MQRFKLDLSLEQFIAVARGDVIDIQSVKLESYDAPDAAAAKTATTPKKQVVRRPRRTRAQIAADAEAAAMAKSARLPADQPDTTQRAFPWKDPDMNGPVAA